MKAIRLAVFGLVLATGLAAANDGSQTPAGAEVLKQLDAESAEIERDTEVELARWRERTATALKDVQDRFCRQGLLDEALAVREVARRLQSGDNALRADAAPPVVRRALRPFEDELASLRRKAEDRLAASEEKAADELKKVQDAFAREAKLDEAVAVRDLIRDLRSGNGVATANVLPDPVYVNNPPADIGKVFYYEVGGSLGGVVYGTDVYTTGSPLGTAAVHSGVLKVDQRGVVKVTILPGQGQYETTTRHGVTSSSYGAWSVSFKVERAPAWQLRRPAVKSTGLDKPNG